MSAFALTGRRDDPAMEKKGILQQEPLVLSRAPNPRTLWAHTASTSLAVDVPNLLVVAPQFPVWFVPEDGE